MLTTLSTSNSKAEGVTSRKGQLRSIHSSSACAAVVKSDATVLSFGALYVGGAGSVVIKSVEGGADVTFAAVPAGTILPVSGVRVMAASTATSIVTLE